MMTVSVKKHKIAGCPLKAIPPFQKQYLNKDTHFVLIWLLIFFPFCCNMTMSKDVAAEHQTPLELYNVTENVIKISLLEVIELELELEPSCIQAKLLYSLH